MRLTFISSVAPQASRRRQFRLRIIALSLLSWLASGHVITARADELVAVDDLRLVSLLESQVDLPFSWLLSNDTASPETPTLVLERAPLHGQLLLERAPLDGPLLGSPIGFTYLPSDTFWAVGSDQLTYRLESGSDTAYASVQLAAQRFYVSPTLATSISFDDPTDQSLLQRTGLSFQTAAPIKGSGSLAVQTIQTGSSSYFSLPFDGTDNVQPIATDNGNVNFCLGDLPDGNGFGYGEVSSDDPAGYVLLIGPKKAELDTAVIRVGLEQDFSGLFLEVKEVSADGTETWHRTKTLAQRSDTLRIQVAFDVEGNQMAAVLRFDGLALRSPVVPFYGPHPVNGHIGYVLPPSGGVPRDLEFDEILVATENEAPGAGVGLVGPLLMADGVAADGSSAWAGSYGAGLLASSAPLTGDTGFELSPINAVAFSSYQVPINVAAQQLSLRARIDTSTLSITEGRRLAIVNIQSSSHALFGLPDYELRLTEISGEPMASLRFHQGDDVWTGMAWTAVDGEHVVRVQVGLSDSPRVNNGWARLWVDGKIEQELFDLPNDSLDLRTVHLGAKHFLLSMVSGSIRFDELTVTK